MKKKKKRRLRKTDDRKIRESVRERESVAIAAVVNDYLSTPYSTSSSCVIDHASGSCESFVGSTRPNVSHLCGLKKSSIEA